MSKLHAVKLVMDNGMIEDCKEAIVIIKDGESMSLEAINLLPLDQMILVSIAFYEMFNEYFSEEEQPKEFQLFEQMLRYLISSLLNTNNQTKGDVLQ